MALPPTIPTSFVPYSASAQTRQFRTDYSGAFKFLVFGVLGLAVVLALGVFVYGRVLSAKKTSTDAKLVEAREKIRATDIENFVRLRNRLVSSQTLLNNHSAISGFFSALEKLVPATARFSTLHIAVDNVTGTTKLTASGVAKNFNVLAAVSGAFSDDGRIKDAIFSNIVVNQKNNSVSFALSATLDPKLVAFTPTASPVTVVPTATTTATTTTP